MRQSCYVLVVALLDISKLLNTGLDAESLSICVRLCESGVNPEALANVIRELRRESAALKVTNVSLRVHIYFDQFWVSRKSAVAH